MHKRKDMKLQELIAHIKIEDAKEAKNVLRLMLLTLLLLLNIKLQVYTRVVTKQEAQKV